MSSCCASSADKNTTASKHDCPVCQNTCLNVSLKTMLHHIEQPWAYSFTDEQYYYCNNTSCSVVYFPVTGDIIRQADIRGQQHITNTSSDELVCYCFGVTKSQASINKGIKDFVIKQTKLSMCSCETANPSGRCCLKHFPKFKN